MARVFPLLLALLSSTALADAAEEVRTLLEADEPPPGVVFEVVSGDEATLERTLPEIREHARRLRERFPGLPLAVLTHGSEQFSLLTENTPRYGDLHALVTTLGAEEQLPVEVCGNHASFRDKGRADFPDYVEVVSSAGSRLSEYREAGYTIIVM